MLAALKRPKFEPFRIEMSDGSSYPVYHPDMCMLTKRAAYVGLKESEKDLVAQRAVICDLVHITRLVPLDSNSNARRKKE